MSFRSETKIKTNYFPRAIFCNDGKDYEGRLLWDSLEKNRDLFVFFDQVIECYSLSDAMGQNCYFLKIKNGGYRLYTNEQIKEFEDQFPFFPYYRKNRSSAAFDQIKELKKKNSELEKQNLILLSHVEAILTCLRMRGITDDNLDFTLPK